MRPRVRHRLAGLAFPPGERRAELIGTLIDAEEELGGRAPGPRETVDIVRHGLRARLGWPRSWLVVPIAVSVVLLGAFTAGVYATQAAWRFVPPLPEGERAAEISRTVFPGLRVYGGGGARDFAHEPDAEGGIVNGWVDYGVAHTDETRDVVAYTAGARQRLAAAGWAVHDAGEFDEHEFWAQRDGLVLRFAIWYYPGAPWYDGDGGAQYSLTRATPDWIRWAAPAGAPFGAVIAFLVFGWFSRRVERAELPVPIMLSVYAGSVLLTVPALVQAARLWWRPDPAVPPIEPFWRPLFYDAMSLPTNVLILVVAGMLLVAALQRPFPLEGPWSRATPRGRWLAAGVITALLAVPAVWSAASAAPCGPDGLPRSPAGTRALFSTEARVYVDPRSTQDQRNLLEAAIGRSGGSPDWDGNEGGGATWFGLGCGVPGPWFDVSFSAPGHFDRLVAEVSGMPGVLAVHRVAG